MRSLMFDSEQALCQALAAGLVPPEILWAPVRATYLKLNDIPDAQGVVVTPEQALSAAVVKALKAKGLSLTNDDHDWHPKSTPLADHWLAALPLHRTSDPAPQSGVTLFLVPAGGSLLDLIAHLF